MRHAKPHTGTSTVLYDSLPMAMDITASETHLRHYDMVLDHKLGLSIHQFIPSPPYNRTMRTTVAYTSLQSPSYTCITPPQNTSPDTRLTTLQPYNTYAIASLQFFKRTNHLYYACTFYPLPHNIPPSHLHPHT